MKTQVAPQVEFYQKHLDQVSRSFAFCIRQLKEGLRSRVGLAYLLCRILDTVEDSAYPDARQKFQQMAEFNAFIAHPPTEVQIRKWLSMIPPSARAEERELLNDISIVLSGFHALPAQDQAVMRDAILSMSNGMAYFLRRSTDKGSANSLRLSTGVEVNRYCFFVAGVVGEMLTRLVAAQNSKFRLTPESLLRSHQFGLFLQKINLLKDQIEDEQVGRFLVPSQDELWESLDKDMQGAMDYLLAIPLEEKEYRLFCGWSLFLGLASVPWIRRSWAKRAVDKIPRPVTEKILSEVTERIDDNVRLRGLFERTRPAIVKRRIKDSQIADEFPEFPTLYRGNLTREHLQRLGLLTKPLVERRALTP